MKTRQKHKNTYKIETPYEKKVILHACYNTHDLPAYLAPAATRYNRRVSPLPQFTRLNSVPEKLAYASSEGWIMNGELVMEVLGRDAAKNHLIRLLGR